MATRKCLLAGCRAGNCLWLPCTTLTRHILFDTCRAHSTSRLCTLETLPFRVEAMLLQKEFYTIMASLAQSVDVLSDTISKLITSQALPQILSLLLEMGNFCNTGNGLQTLLQHADYAKEQILVRHYSRGLLYERTAVTNANIVVAPVPWSPPYTTQVTPAEWRLALPFNLSSTLSRSNPMMVRASSGLLIS